MNYSLAWTQASLQPVLIIGLTLFGLLGYWITIHSEKLKSRFVLHFGEERTKVAWIMFWRYCGLFFYGLLPAIVIFAVLPNNLAFYGLSFINLPESLLWTAGIGAILLLLQINIAKTPANTDQYPQIRVSQWDAKLVLKNSFGWFIYLLAYEFMYRGFLLFGLLEVFGTWPAIMVNIIIYSLAHIPKGNREAVLAIPFGIILCIITIRTGTIWFAVLIHVVLAYLNDYIAISASKTMKFVKHLND